MRYIVNADFQKVPLGTYSASGVLDYCRFVRDRARPILGSGTPGRADLQLVGAANAEFDGLHDCTCPDERLPCCLRIRFWPLGLLALRFHFGRPLILCIRDVRWF